MGVRGQEAVNIPLLEGQKSPPELPRELTHAYMCIHTCEHTHLLTITVLKAFMYQKILYAKHCARSLQV